MFHRQQVRGGRFDQRVAHQADVELAGDDAANSSPRSTNAGFVERTYGRAPGDIIAADLAHQSACARREDSMQQGSRTAFGRARGFETDLEASAEDASILGHLMCQISQITRAQGLTENGFRVVINNGSDGGETVPHLHVHLLGGRPMLWPPG